MTRESPDEVEKDLLTSSQRLQIYRQRWASFYAISQVDWYDLACQHESSCWFVCKYGGGQDFEKVVDWPISDVERACGYLVKFIEREAPKSS